VFDARYFNYVCVIFCTVSKDATTVSYGRLQFKRTNITAVKLIDQSSPTVASIMEDIKFVQQRINLNTRAFKAENITVIYLYIHLSLLLTTYIVNGNVYEISRCSKVHALLMFDAVNVYAKALRGIGGTKSIKAEPNSCANRSTTGWSSGFRLVNYMRVVSRLKIIGRVRFI